MTYIGINYVLAYIDINLILTYIDIMLNLNTIDINIKGRDMKCLKCQLEIDSQVNAHYGLHPACFTEWFNVPELTEFVSLKRRASDSDTEHDASLPSKNSSFFHGKFKKYSADLYGESYILKMRQEEAPELPEVEYLCNQIGRLLGIPVADFFYIDFYGEKTFVTKNFIKAGTLTDLQHIYHFRSENEHSCEGLINAIAEKTRRPHDVSIFVKTLLFDSLIGNHDRHGRNMGFVITSTQCVLSPIYDNVSYLSLESGNMLKADFNPTGKINTKETYEPSMRDYVIELNRLGHHEEVKDFYKKLELHLLLKLIDNSYCSIEMKNAIKRLLIKRSEELKNEIDT